MHLIAYSEGLSFSHIEFLFTFNTFKLPQKIIFQILSNNDLDLMELFQFRSFYLQFIDPLQVSINVYLHRIKAG